MAEIDYSALAATLVKGRDEGLYAKAKDVSDLINDLEELAVLPVRNDEDEEGYLEQRCELLESALRILTDLLFDAGDEKRQMKGVIERHQGVIERLEGERDRLKLIKGLSA